MIWNYRMLPYCESVLEFDPQRLVAARNSFHAMIADVINAPVEPPAP